MSTRTGPAIRLALAGGLLLLMSQALPGQPGTIFAVNYDLVFNVGEARYSMRENARVRSGNAIPMDMQSHRLELQITESDADAIIVSVTIFERTDNRWYRMNAEDIAFPAETGSPLEYKWTSADVDFELAMVVGFASGPGS